MNKLLAIALVLGLASAAHAQAGFGRDMRERDRVTWAPSLEKAASADNISPMERRRLKAMGIEPADKKYIFVYIRPLTEEKEPNEFSTCQDAVEGSRGAWAFVKMDFDKENPYQKAWGVKGAPACVGCDLYANEFIKLGGPTVDTIRNIIRGTPGEVAKYETKLKADFEKAMALVKSDEEKASKLLVDICLGGKTGYKEVADATTKLAEITEIIFKKGELASSVSPETGVEYYDDLVKIYRASAPGVKAEILLAILEHAKGSAPSAIARLQRIMKSDARTLKAEIDSAAKALDDISKAGDVKLEAALNLPDKAAGREAVRKLAKDYAGTEAGKHAADASK